MGTKSDSFRAFNETCPIMAEKFLALEKCIDSIEDLIPKEKFDDLMRLMNEADRADSDIRHKFRDIHIDALDLAQEWEKKHDKLNDEIEKKDDEIKSLEKELCSKNDEVECLEETIDKLETRVERLEKENNEMIIA